MSSRRRAFRPAVIAIALWTVLGLGGLGGPAPVAGTEGPLPLGLASYPPCVDLELSADVSGGKPPFTYTWILPSGEQLTGSPAVLDTEKLAPGTNTIVLAVDNENGTDMAELEVEIEPLEFALLPAWALTIPGGREVRFAANTRGATEWRWHWGDGTTSDWHSGCDGSAPTHTYPAEGLYVAWIEARNCLTTLLPPLLSSAFVVDVPRSTGIFNDSFENGDTSRWSIVQQ